MFKSSILAAGSGGTALLVHHTVERAQSLFGDVLWLITAFTAFVAFLATVHKIGRWAARWYAARRKRA
jgi:hypothetical protein